MDSNNYYIWFNFKTTDVTKDMPKKATIFAPEEFEISYDWQHHDGFDRIKDIDLTLLFGSANRNYYNGRTNYPANAKIEIWPTFWCNATYKEFTRQPKTITYNNLDKLYISLNNKGHYHRCLMIDELYNHGLLKEGAVTFHDPSSTRYTWRYWNPTQLVLDQEYPNTMDSYKTLPTEFNTTLLSLVAESTLETVFLTEKTWTPILFAKPFIVFGAVGTHKVLRDLGFELYEELFDYEFDNVQNPTERLNMIISNLKKLVGQDYNALRQKIASKAEFNKQHMIKIATSRSYFPPVMLNHLSEIRKNPDVAKGRDSYYLGLENLLTN